MLSYNGRFRNMFRTEVCRDQGSYPVPCVSWSATLIPLALSEFIRLPQEFERIKSYVEVTFLNRHETAISIQYPQIDNLETWLLRKL